VYIYIICVYICEPTCVWIYIYIYIWIYIYVFVRLHVCVCMYIRIYTYMFVRRFLPHCFHFRMSQISCLHSICFFFIVQVYFLYNLVDSNTLQHTATHCNTLQHTATHCNAHQHTFHRLFSLMYKSTFCILLEAAVFPVSSSFTLSHSLSSNIEKVENIGIW